jgi:hypothetical protein
MSVTKFHTHTKQQANTLCGQNVEFVFVKLAVRKKRPLGFEELTNLIRIPTDSTKI